MDKYYSILLKETKKALKKKEIPVGALIVKNGKIISKGHNCRQHKKDVTGHAEIECIRKAEKKLKDWRLDECELYTTLYPCEMCQNVIAESRIEKVYYYLERKNEIQKKRKNLEIKKKKTNTKEYEQMIGMFFENLRK